MNGTGTKAVQSCCSCQNASRLFVTGSPSTRPLFASLQLAKEGHAWLEGAERPGTGRSSSKGTGVAVAVTWEGAVQLTPLQLL